MSKQRRYELLQDDDVIQEGDEYFGTERPHVRTWLPVSEVDLWQPVSKAKTSYADPGHLWLYRRPITVVKPEAAPCVPVTSAVETPTGPGEGYRWVAVGEVLEEGDEYQSGAEWETTVCVGQLVATFEANCYRRVVPVPTPTPDTRPALPEGYRFLEVGEQILTGDLVIDGSPDRKSWGPTSIGNQDVYISKSFRQSFVRKVTVASPIIPLQWSGRDLQWFNGTAWVTVPDVACPKGSTCGINRNDCGTAVASGGGL